MANVRPLAAIAFLIAAPVFAQGQGPGSSDYVGTIASEERESGSARFKLGAGYLYQFETDLDDNLGGDVSIQRAYGAGGASFQLTPGLDLGLRFAYEGGWYDWGGNNPLFLGGTRSPWSNAQGYQLGARLGMRIDSQWSAGISFYGNSAGEWDADFNDTVTVGGTWTVAWRPDPNFMIGGGMLVATQLEDDALIIPLFLIDWKINDSLRLTNVGGPEAYPTGAGLELIYAASSAIELGIGGRYETRRFRLDDDGPAPEGIGEDTTFALWGRLGWNVTDQLHTDFLVGGMLGQELELRNSSGRRLASVDVDPSLFVAAFISFRF